MKKNILRIFLIILICFWLAMVFGLSNDNAEKSSGLSLKIAKIFSSDENVLKILEPIIRKLAHLSEYMVGGVLFYGLFLTFDLSPKKQVIFSVILGVLYSISDEIHQLFVPRTSSEKYKM